MPANDPQVGYMDSSAMGRLLGAAGRLMGGDKAGTRLRLGASLQPHGERGLRRDGQSQGTP